MLRFILRQPARRSWSLRLSEQDFIQKVAKFKIADMKKSELVEHIEKLSSVDNLNLAQNRLFMQVAGFLQPEEILTVKEAVILKATRLFQQKGALGKGGQTYRDFLAKCLSQKLFSPVLVREFLAQTFLAWVRQQKKEELATFDAATFLSVIETCMLHGMLTSEELMLSTTYALQKLNFSSRRFHMLSILTVTHGFYLKKFRAQLADPNHARAAESLLLVAAQATLFSGQASAEDCLDFLRFMTHLGGLRDVFEGSEKEAFFAQTWALLELGFEKHLRNNSQQLRDILLKSDESSLLPFLEELNSTPALYKSPAVAASIFGPLQERLETRSKELTSAGTASLVRLCFRNDEKFVLDPRYLANLELSVEDPRQALSNVQMILELFGRNSEDERLGQFVVASEKLLLEVLAREELVEDRQVLKHLLSVFQALTAMNRGSVGLFKRLFEVFNRERVLEQIGLIPLFIKFLPALGIKTKKLTGSATNISDENASNILGIAHAIGQEVRPPLVELWKSLDRFVCKRLDHVELDKIPSILIHFIYGQIVVPDMAIFQQATRRLRGHMHRFSAKQLAQSLYSLSRVRNSAVVDVLNEGIQEFALKALGSQEPLSQERVAILWAASNAGQMDVSVFTQLLQQEIPHIQSYNDRRFVQFMNALGSASLSLPLPLMQQLLGEVLAFFKASGE